MSFRELVLGDNAASSPLPAEESRDDAELVDLLSIARGQASLVSSSPRSVVPELLSDVLPTFGLGLQ